MVPHHLILFVLIIPIILHQTPRRNPSRLATQPDTACGTAAYFASVSGAPPLTPNRSTPQSNTSNVNRRLFPNSAETEVIGSTSSSSTQSLWDEEIDMVCSQSTSSRRGSSASAAYMDSGPPPRAVSIDLDALSVCELEKLCRNRVEIDRIIEKDKMLPPDVPRVGIVLLAICNSYGMYHEAPGYLGNRHESEWQSTIQHE